MDRLNVKEVTLPLIPLRELVIFPSVIMPILVGRDKSIQALKIALSQHDGSSFWRPRRTRPARLPRLTRSTAWAPSPASKSRRNRITAAIGSSSKA